MACASPQAGNHHDLFTIEALFDELCDLVQEAQIVLEGLFMNADRSFDARTLREACFRRDETNVQNWLAFHFLAFTVLLLRRIPPDEKP